MLNKAKSHKSTAETVKRAKRTKKNVENKPTLIVGKHNGQYHIELQATPESPDLSPNQCTPLIYKIESAKDKAKLKRKDNIRRRLVNAAVKEVWSDPYHPEACEKVCLPAFQQTIGNFPETGDDHIFDEAQNDFDSSCDDGDISSSCNSSEVNWEIHFTPPYISNKSKFLINQESNN
ncbi:jg25513 [Pararge aegeria aegeria]|uniref:Jg25513 protein n=2 Tax=Pararge aegeria TaxID=116150 RepID=A0A8S4S624_9NEOP|nr:jg25513 [Pararge aegeria aegeria]